MYFKPVIALVVAAVATTAVFPRPGAHASEDNAPLDAELQATVAQLTPEQKSALLVIVKGLLQAAAPQESPEEGAMKTVEAYVKAAETLDIDILMAQVSDQFNHHEVGDKAALRGWIEQYKTEGMLEDIKGNTAEAKTEVDGDVVTVYPVEMEGLFGTVTYEFKLKKDGDAWKIVGFDMTGV